MKKAVLTFGLISGAILSAMMLATLPFLDRIGFDRGEIIGYTSMVVAFLLIFFGVRSYRDNVAGGTVGFGRALAVAVLISVVASLCYVATWQVVYYKLAPDFGTKYQNHILDKARRNGESEEAIARKKAELDGFLEHLSEPCDQCGDHLPGAAARGADRLPGVGWRVEPPEESGLRVVRDAWCDKGRSKHMRTDL